MHTVILPILDANMTHGTVRAWLKREGDVVRAGEPLFEVETDKVNAEVEAESSGILRRIVAPVGTRVPVLGVLAFVGEAEEEVPDWEGGRVILPHADGLRSPLLSIFSDVHVSGGGAVREPPEEARRIATAASPAARRLARQRGVALEQIRGSGPRGEVTRADVEAASVAIAGGSGALDPAFLAILRRDGATLRALSSETKVQLYRRHGAQIGEGVRIEPGALIVADHLTIGGGSVIGADSQIECERLTLGRLVAFGRRTRIHCRAVQIGDALWSKDDVMIGGGGSDEPDARLTAGDACFFGEGAYLNTCRPLTLGDEVCIGSRAMLFTHSHWQSVLRGYASSFAPIVVGDHVFIGNNAFLFPGVTIGAGATVMVNSFVAVNIAPQTLVGGVPAQVIRHITVPSPAEQIAIVRDRLMPEIAAAVQRQGHGVRQHTSGESIRLDLGAAGSVVFVPAWAPGAIADAGGRVVVLAFAADAAAIPGARVTLFDLTAARVAGVQDALSDEVRELCRRRGIRFRPYAWRYRVGHFEGDRFVGRAAMEHTDGPQPGFHRL
jgi:acetyltransferase-like isoleucine patch superfamily enzyme